MLSSMSKLLELFVIASLVLSSHVVVRFLQFPIHVGPFSTHMPHDFIGGPLWMLLLQLLSILLAEVNVGRQGFFGSGYFSLCSHVRTYRLIVVS
jgi:hypothetical protein